MKQQDDSTLCSDSAVALQSVASEMQDWDSDNPPPLVSSSSDSDDDSNNNGGNTDPAFRMQLRSVFNGAYAAAPHFDVVGLVRDREGGNIGNPPPLVGSDSDSNPPPLASSSSDSVDDMTSETDDNKTPAMARRTSETCIASPSLNTTRTPPFRVPVHRLAKFRRDFEDAIHVDTVEQVQQQEQEDDYEDSMDKDIFYSSSESENEEQKEADVDPPVESLTMRLMRLKIAELEKDRVRVANIKTTSKPTRTTKRVSEVTQLSKKVSKRTQTAKGASGWTTTAKSSSSSKGKAIKILDSCGLCLLDLKEPYSDHSNTAHHRFNAFALKMAGLHYKAVVAELKTMGWFVFDTDTSPTERFHQLIVRRFKKLHPEISCLKLHEGTGSSSDMKLTCDHADITEWPDMQADACEYSLESYMEDNPGYGVYDFHPGRKD